MGLGTQDQITEVLVTGEFSSNTGLLRHGFLGSRVDKTDLQILFNRALEQGCLDDMVLLGHLHPSGNAAIRGVNYHIPPSEELLIPSMGRRSPQDGGDLAFYKAFRELNPDCGIQLAAIVANTPDGPKVRVYNMQDLRGINRCRDIDSVPQVTIDL